MKEQCGNCKYFKLVINQIGERIGTVCVYSAINPFLNEQPIELVAYEGDICEDYEEKTKNILH